MPLSVLIAPDTFKGSLPADLACAAIARGVRRAVPDAICAEFPMADGGEGSLDILGRVHGFTVRELTVTGPLGHPTPGRYLISADRHRAIAELALASGLTLMAPEDRRPLSASTFGTGELLRSALLELAPGGEITLCLGGSATSDGGAGLLSALGFCFLDVDGDELPPGGAALLDLARIDDGSVLPQARTVSWRLACDVQTPLTGPQGAAALFGPQKGATPDEVDVLEAALSRLADVIQAQTGIRLHNLPGAGAAGGTSGSLHALLGAELVSGAAQIARSIGLEAATASGTYDLLLTGEGRLDEQSRHGKVVGVLVELAHAAGLPVIALAGSVDLHTPWPELSAAFALAPGPLSLAESQARAAELLEECAAQVMGVWVAARRGR
ncbi:glycerate kinase [Deinococcus sp.]|uniref:glycerate kinase n=1 Tax=Deinococcus sp. TaxID=47478 RepID=UPI0025EB1B90|nr:glycerate kinase [Deinococcus sp.]